MSTLASGALDGIRVIDLTRFLSGPFCTQLLADSGADVIKIESSAGDPVRQQGVLRDGFSGYFAQFNRNKRSVVLDLRSDHGQEALRRLLQNADVLVENFRPEVLDKMGWDAATLETLNPRLVVASINGFGSDGPYRDRPAFDFIAQAMSGFMAVNGEADGEPLRAAPPISDLVAGLYAAFGILSALQARQHTGRGQRVESALTNGLVSMLGYLSAEYFATGQPPARTGNHHPIVAPYGLFTASDGEIAIAPSNDSFVAKLFAVLALTALLDDPRFANNDARMQHREALTALVNDRLRTATTAEWIERLNAAGVPCGRVQGLDEVFHDPQVLAQDMVLDVDHPGFGPVRMTGFPVKLSATPNAIRRPSPGLGEHTVEVLGELGMDDEPGR